MREEEKKRTSQKSAFQRFISKRWALPAIYLACAAVLLTGVLWFQNSNNESTTPDVSYGDSNLAGKGHREPAVEVNSKVENFKMPVLNEDSAVIKKEFYDVKGSKEAQEAALVFYNNKYEPNKGIDIAMQNGETFDVVASMSGTVTKVQDDTILGNLIEVEHEKGIVTRYSSVKEIAVEVGDTVTQGQAIAKAGQSLLNSEAGIHTHFEIRKDQVAVNPIEFMDKNVVALKEAQVVNSKASALDKKEDAADKNAEVSEDDDTKTDDAAAVEDEKPSEDDQPSEDETQENQNN
ncbi:M23 family metallopeptidase [Peribacillus alkalitolerans]|uniref:M23 family metallopeptidase n=1 Tax=Peribacillus alkalitolerans TaxID=1550385 RepID=UPI0013D8BC02|nr:M23 family metallopeptidase [Peribacillus alkalitolerans]